MLTVPQELAAYRKLKEEEALKMSVLDAEAAAKFSTAAALDARDKLSVPSEWRWGHALERGLPGRLAGWAFCRCKAWRSYVLHIPG